MFAEFHAKLSNPSCLLSGRKERASEERKNDLASGREMASYNVDNLGIESPAFERFIFINLLVRK